MERVAENQSLRLLTLGRRGAWIVVVLAACAGCVEDNTTSGEVAVAESYDFETASYAGQTHRHLLISELKGYVSGLTDRIDGGQYMPTNTDEVVDSLDFYFRFDSDSDGETAFTKTGALPLLETTFNDVARNKDLVSKLAGNDTVTDHKCWSATDTCASSEFEGWPGVESPESLVSLFFAMVADNAIARANGELDWDVHLTAEGHDLNQLIEKFLTVAIAFSQGADDYLDSDVDGKGLRASNTVPEDGGYTDLAHAWDEGFGYFGAARNYGDYTDDEIASKGGREEWQGCHDTNGDEMLSLLSECNFGASVNAAKRDRGSAAEAATDFTQDIFDAFLAGRALIRDNPGPLDDAQLATLEGYRDTIVWGWEKVYAATVVHYINDVIVDMAAVGTDAYSFADHAKHWSELKGFALGFQFSPRSPLSDQDFVAFHAYVGAAPVLTGVDALAAYKTDLLSARALLRDAYDFDAANMGDEDGLGGW